MIQHAQRACPFRGGGVTPRPNGSWTCRCSTLAPRLASAAVSRPRQKRVSTQLVSTAKQASSQQRGRWSILFCSTCSLLPSPANARSNESQTSAREALPQSRVALASRPPRLCACVRVRVFVHASPLLRRSECAVVARNSHRPCPCDQPVSACPVQAPVAVSHSRSCVGLPLSAEVVASSPSDRRSLALAGRGLASLPFCVADAKIRSRPAAIDCSPSLRENFLHPAWSPDWSRGQGATAGVVFLLWMHRMDDTWPQHRHPPSSCAGRYQRRSRRNEQRTRDRDEATNEQQKQREASSFRLSAAWARNSKLATATA